MKNREEILKRHIENGVNIVDPSTTYIEDDVIIGEGTTIYPMVYIHSNVKIGKNCAIGPFSNIRKECVLHDNVKIGAFVEIKKAVIGEGTKAGHLAYLGDAEVGKNVNVGCGVITCNYDGENKHKTTIGDNVFVGSNVNLIAPVTLSDNSYIAAGSTINKDVPENALAIARERQTNKEDWVKKS